MPYAYTDSIIIKPNIILDSGTVWIDIYSGRLFTADRDLTQLRSIPCISLRELLYSFQQLDEIIRIYQSEEFTFDYTVLIIRLKELFAKFKGEEDKLPDEIKNIIKITKKDSLTPDDLFELHKHCLSLLKRYGIGTKPRLIHSKVTDTIVFKFDTILRESSFTPFRKLTLEQIIWGSAILQKLSLIIGAVLSSFHQRSQFLEIMRDPYFLLVYGIGTFLTFCLIYSGWHTNQKFLRLNPRIKLVLVDQRSE